MLAVHVAVMQIVNMIAVQHRFVSAPWAVGVAVSLGLRVLSRGHGASLSSEPSHAYMRSYECQGFTLGPGRVRAATEQAPTSTVG